MKANELRIDNWVNYKIEDRTYKQGRISSLNSKKVTINGNDVVKYCNIYPIELTADILTKSGFAKHNLNGYKEHFIYVKYTKRINFELTGLWNNDFSFLFGDRALKIYNAHQLQNLYYDITGEELNINF